jgi:hypothetical protein
MASLALHLLTKLTEFLNFSHFSSRAVMSTFYHFKTVPSSVKCIFEIAYSKNKLGQRYKIVKILRHPPNSGGLTRHMHLPILSWYSPISQTP